MGDSRAEHPHVTRPLWQHHVGATILRLSGWTYVGPFPREPKLVMVSGPHTSNWDFMLMLLGALHHRVRIRVMVKDSLFRFPLDRVLRGLGAFAIDRSQAQGVVGQMVDLFHAHEHLLLVVPASGTRSRKDHWKSGFYWVAHEAQVPIALCYMDYEKKIAGFKGLLYTTGDVAADMDRIREAYADVQPMYPDCKSDIRLRDESPTSAESSHKPQRSA